MSTNLNSRRINNRGWRRTTTWLLALSVAWAGLGCSQSSQTLAEAASSEESVLPYSFSSGITILPDSISPTSISKFTKTSAVPDGMVFVPGGLTRMGSVKGGKMEQPEFWTQVRSFFMDIHPVTVGEFRKFVKATGFVTQAEKFTNGGVFVEEQQDWILKEGANWQYPQGTDHPKSPDDHPVTQVSWNDAQAYCRWADKRLPYEIEWEHAARNAVNSRALYPFGNTIEVKGKYQANIWQGKFPEKNYVEDGFRFTSPVGKFGKTELGLTDMTGNVWQWCQDWKMTYTEIITKQNPANPAEKAQRGGSFLCEPGWCHGYRVSGRSFSTPETSLMHVGFRCVKDAR